MLARIADNSRRVLKVVRLRRDVWLPPHTARMRGNSEKTRALTAMQARSRQFFLRLRREQYPRRSQD